MINQLCPQCGCSFPEDQVFCQRSKCIALREKRDRAYTCIDSEYAKRKLATSKRHQYKISVMQMNKAIQYLGTVNAQESVPATKRPLPEKMQAKIDAHTRGECGCGSDAVCKDEVRKIKIKARNEMPIVFEPVLDTYSIDLYNEYANRNLKMTPELKTRLEVIEDRAITYLTQTPLRPDLVNTKHLHNETYSVDEVEDWYEPRQYMIGSSGEKIRFDSDINNIVGNEDGTLTVLTKGFKDSGLLKGAEADNQLRPLSSFDVSLSQIKEADAEKKKNAKPTFYKHRRDQHLDSVANRWVRDFLAEQKRAGKPTFKEVEADFDRLFVLNQPRKPEKPAA